VETGIQAIVTVQCAREDQRASLFQIAALAIMNSLPIKRIEIRQETPKQSKRWASQVTIVLASWFQPDDIVKLEKNLSRQHSFTTVVQIEAKVN
jgi:hypothetical protein